MEFHEKLQQLRRHNGMTQEQLAERLFVSRTAVSKWESGRGYPNLESLKSLSKLFSVSIDELLSNGELLHLAATENRTNLTLISTMAFGLLDVIPAFFLLIPLFGQEVDGAVRAFPLFSHPEISGLLRALYALFLVCIPLLGVFEIAVNLAKHERWLRLCQPGSFVLCSAAILLFAISRQPYVTAFLFLLFAAKVLLLLREHRIQ